MSDASQHLLFGLLALQNGFITRSQLVAAFGTWTDDKSKSLDELLLEQGALTVQKHELLKALAAAHLEQHANDPEQSLAALSSIESVRQDLERVSDSDLQQTLLAVSVGYHTVDPNATRMPPPISAAQARFRILRPHAKGGLGEVFVAEDGELPREVALKEIQLKHAYDADAQSRFLREAEITGGLEHPGIVPVYGLGTYADGRPFYAMKFIKGDSLKDAIERFHGKTAKAAGKPHSANFQGTEFRQLLQRFIDVCQAIQYAHDRNVLHRDLKPGNIMLGHYGETLVVDWGLAKPLGEHSSEQSATSGEKPLIPKSSLSGSSANETLPGSAVGTPAYMSPEQAAGEIAALGPATDVYSLGATLYDLLTGQPPIFGANIGEMLRNVQRGEIRPPRNIQRSVPKPLEAICLKAMSLTSQDRYPSPKVMAEDLEHFLADEPIIAAPDTVIERATRLTRKHRGVVGTTVAAILLIVMGSGLAWFREAGLRKNLATANGSLTTSLASEKKAKQNAQHEKSEADRARIKASQLADQNAQLAAQERNARIKAERELNRSVVLAYAQQLAAAQQMLRQGNHAAALAKLNSCTWDLRGFEFHLLRSRALKGSTQARLSVPKAVSLQKTPFSTIPGPMLTVNPVTIDLAFATNNHSAVSVQTVNNQSRFPTLTVPLEGFVYSPNGKLLVTGGNSIVIWDATDGREIRRLPPGKYPCFSKNGQRIAALSTEGIAVWDVVSGKLVDVFTQPQFSGPYVTSLALDSEGDKLAAGSVTGEICIWSVSQSIPPITFPTHSLGDQSVVSALAFMQNGARLVSAGWDYTLAIWDLSSEPIHVRMRGHTGRIHSLAISNDDSRIASVGGDDDGSVRLWHADTGLALLELSVWDTDEGQQLRELLASNEQLSQLPFEELRRGNFPIDRELSVALVNLLGSFQPISAAFVNSDNSLFTAHSSYEAIVFSPKDSLEPNVIEGLFSPALSISFSRDGQWLVGGCSFQRFGEIGIWDLKSGNEVFRASPEPGCAIWATAISAEGNTVATVVESQTLPPKRQTLVWSDKDFVRHVAVDGSPIPSILKGRRLTNSSLVAVGGKPASEFVAVADASNVQLIDADSGELGRVFHGHQDDVLALGFSRDFNLMITGSADKTARIWNVQSGAVVQTLKSHAAPVTCVAFGSDDKTFATGSVDGDIRLWSGRNAAESRQLRVESVPIQLAFTSKDAELIIAGSSGELSVWNFADWSRVAIDTSRWKSTGSVQSIDPLRLKIAVKGFSRRPPQPLHLYDLKVFMSKTVNP